MEDWLSPDQLKSTFLDLRQRGMSEVDAFKRTLVEAPDAQRREIVGRLGSGLPLGNLLDLQEGPQGFPMADQPQQTIHDPTGATTQTVPLDPAQQPPVGLAQQPMPGDAPQPMQAGMAPVSSPVAPVEPVAPPPVAPAPEPAIQPITPIEPQGAPAAEVPPTIGSGGKVSRTYAFPKDLGEGRGAPTGEVHRRNMRVDEIYDNAPGSMTPDQVKAMAVREAKDMGLNPVAALGILGIESGASWNSVGRNKDGSFDFGPMQLNTRYHDPDKVAEPVENIRAGLKRLKDGLKSKGSLKGSVTRYRWGGKDPTETVKGKTAQQRMDARYKRFQKAMAAGKKWMAKNPAGPDVAAASTAFPLGDILSKGIGKLAEATRKVQENQPGGPAFIERLGVGATAAGDQVRAIELAREGAPPQSVARVAGGQPEFDQAPGADPSAPPAPYETQPPVEPTATEGEQQQGQAIQDPLAALMARMDQMAKGLESGLADTSSKYGAAQGRVQGQIGESRGKIAALVDKHVTAEVDPRRYWKNQHVAVSVLKGIGAVLGAAAHGLSGGKMANTALERMDREIDRDIQLQLEEIKRLGTSVDTEKNFLASLYKDMGNLQQAMVAEKQIMLGTFKAKAAMLGTAGKLAGGQGKKAPPADVRKALDSGIGTLKGIGYLKKMLRGKGYSFFGDIARIAGMENREAAINAILEGVGFERWRTLTGDVRAEQDVRNALRAVRPGKLAILLDGPEAFIKRLDALEGQMAMSVKEKILTNRQLGEWNISPWENRYNVWAKQRAAEGTATTGGTGVKVKQ